MTIDRLRLTNFQRHERFDLTLDPGVTTLVGPSDAGKSSVIRALRWLALNRPAGDGFVRRGGGRSDVTEARARCDGVTVRRWRGSGDNAYAVGAEEYRAFGQDVPPAVSRIVGLGPDNFGGQHDAPYWLGLSEPDLARELNRIVDLDVIDRTASRLASRLRGLRAERDVVASRLAEASAEAARTLPAAAMDADLREVERLGAEADKAEERVKWLEEAISGLEEAEAAASRPVPDASGLERLKGEAEEAGQKAWLLESLLEEIRLADERVGERRKELERSDGKLKKELGGRCPLCGGVMK